MNTYRCFAEIVDPLNVWRAWRDMAAGKRLRPAVAAFELDAPGSVVRLAAELADGTYLPGPYQILRVTDPKPRIIAAAPVRDRVVHHAVHRILSPLLDRSFVDQSYACLPGRGPHRALLRFRQGLRRHRFVLQLDVRRYFPSIDRGTLYALLCRKLPEEPLRGLLATILDSGAGLYQRGDVVQFLGWDSPGSTGRGLPIGNLTSQWWGNLYLDGADHYLRRTLRVPHYQRYMDDMALFGDDAGELLADRDALAAWLAAHRGLALKNPDANPAATRGRHLHLGALVSRAGIEPGPRLRRRVAEAVVRHRDRPSALGRALASLRSTWMFG